MLKNYFFQGKCPVIAGQRLFWAACILVISGWLSQVNAQKGTPAYDFLRGVNDSCINPATPIDPLFYPKYGEKAPAAAITIRSGQPFLPSSADTNFYILCGLFLFAGISFRAYPKYFSDLYRVFMRSGFRQKAIKDQLVQNKVASLGLNIIFFITGGLFIYLVARYEGQIPDANWQMRALLCTGFLMAVYLVKYLSLMAGGWIFSNRELADNYAFMVFFVNKIAGLLLLPLVVVLWIGNPKAHPIVVVISYIILTFLILYRYFLVLPMVRNKSGVSPFHFFLYLCTFEILPIWLLVKFLNNYLNSSD